MKKIRIGTGAGYSGDRIEPAVELAEQGDIGYLVFECLAERTIAIAQQAKLRDPALGYDPLLVARLRAVLPACRRAGVRIITNMGAANPRAAAAQVVKVAAELGLPPLRVAIVEGDDVRAQILDDDLRLDESGQPARAMENAIISANAYLGAAPLVEALAQGADVVMCGRVADPCLFLAPMIHEFGWAMDDWDTLGQGIVIGHLLECAGQITGGYFADPGVKDVTGLARLGFPIAEIDATGSAVITKVAGSGGAVSIDTCAEQLLYEIHDPAAYLTPDVSADFTQVSLTADGPDRVLVQGGKGRPRPACLKVSVGYLDGFHGEGQISYAGPGAVARARLAAEIVAERLKLIGVRTEEVRMDLIGIDALHGPLLSAGAEPYEVRLRVAARTREHADAILVANEVETLYTNGPAGGGGATKAVKEIVAMESTLLARDRVAATTTLLTEQR